MAVARVDGEACGPLQDLDAKTLADGVARGGVRSRRRRAVA
jgi:hypothetical protein